MAIQKAGVLWGTVKTQARCMGAEYLKTHPALRHQMVSFTWELECFAEIMGEEACQHLKNR